MLLNIQFAKYHIRNNKSEDFPNMVLSTETFNQSVRSEYAEAVNARYTFQPLWVSGKYIFPKNGRGKSQELRLWGELSFVLKLGENYVTLHFFNQV